MPPGPFRRLIPMTRAPSQGTASTNAAPMPLEAPEIQINDSFTLPRYNEVQAGLGRPRRSWAASWGTRKDMRALHVLAVSAALGPLAVAGCSSSSKSVSPDVTVSACRADPSGGRPTAEGNIVNHTSKASAYAFRVTFSDQSGNESSQGAVAVAKVEAGATAKWSTDGATSAKGTLTCKVTNLSRTSVGG